MELAIPGEDGKKMLTNSVLATVGLKVVEDGKDTVPWYILLSAKQKSWVKTVAGHGFKAGLT
jgi:hypothetical protein